MKASYRILPLICFSILLSPLILANNNNDLLNPLLLENDLVPPSIHSTYSSLNIINETILVNTEMIVDEDIIIESTGKLVLINSTIRMKKPSFSSYKILVENQGNFTLLDSKITTFEEVYNVFDSYTYYIDLSPGSHFLMEGSEILYAGSKTLWDWGGVIVYTDNVLITNSVFKYNHIAVTLDNGNNALLQNNTIEYNTLGVLIWGGDSLNISQNTFISDGLYVCGLSLADSRSLVINANTVNGKPLLFYSEVSNQVFQNLEIGEYIFSFSSNVSIRNTSASSIHFWNSTDTLIEDCFLSNSDEGVRIYNCLNAAIESSEFTNLLTPIHLWGHNVNATDNTIFDNHYGIHVEIECNGVLVASNLVSNTAAGCAISGWGKNIVIKDNMIENCPVLEGISIIGGVNKTVIGNKITAIVPSYGFGIKSSYVTNMVMSQNNISNYESGIICEFNSNLTISNNAIYGNDHGIFCFKSNLGEITDNILQENTYYGVKLENSSNLTIYRNSFYYNNLAGSSQGYDNSTENHWFSPLLSIGNYWSDYDESGAYDIEGPANMKDLFPIDTPFHPPLISELPNNSQNLFRIILPSLVVVLLVLRKKKYLRSTC